MTEFTVAWAASADCSLSPKESRENMILGISPTLAAIQAHPHKLIFT
jgi:hypothetical protein